MVAAMLLGDLFADPTLPHIDVAALAYDARAVRPGSVFFCVRGFTADGHRYAPEAVANGAVALVVDHPLDLNVPEVLVDDVRAAMAPAAARLAGDPTAELAMVGITGTNGKTTTSYLTRALLEAAGRQTGLIGTVTSWVGGVEAPVVRTTPEAIDLQRMFRAMRDGQRRRRAVMEVSSHALALRRADAIHWDVAAFTNLTQDHLDFHTDMEDYFLAKRRLFEVASRAGRDADRLRRRSVRRAARAGLPAGGDDRRSTRPTRRCARPICAPGRRRPTSRWTASRFRAPLPGRFNVLNALVALAAARALGVDDATIAAALPGAGGVPGRFEPVDDGQEFAVVVDYSHKPDALDNVLRTARELATRRADRRRRRGRRPRPRQAPADGRGGRAARRHASSSPPTTRAARIRRRSSRRSRKGPGREAVRIVDRREAIDHAIGLAGPGDVVVIAGKGHETYQEIAGGVKLPFDDREVAREALRARLGR